MTKTAARAFLTGMGMRTADQWPLDKLAAKINSVNEWKDAGGDAPTGATADLLAEVESVLADGGGVIVVNDGGEDLPVQTTRPRGKKKAQNAAKAATEGNVATMTKTKKSGKKMMKVGRATVAANGHAGKAAKAEPAGKDRFGSRNGSKTAMLNAKLSAAKFKTMGELAAEAGLEGTYYNHLNKLVEAGMLEKSGDGYKIAKS